MTTRLKALSALILLALTAFAGAQPAAALTDGATVQDVRTNPHRNSSANRHYHRHHRHRPGRS